MLSLLIFGVLCIIYIVYLSIKLYPGNMPVYPGRRLLLGHIVEIYNGGQMELWENIKKITNFSINNGGVVLFYIGIIPIYLISDPDDCNTVLSACMHKPGFLKKVSKRYLGNSLLLGPVSVWKEHRKILNPTFNQQVLDGFMGIFNSQSRRLVDTWKSKVGIGAFDHLPCVEKNTLETVCLTTAGVDISQQNEFNDKCLKAFSTIMSTLTQRGKNPLVYPEVLYNMSKLKKTEDAHVSITHELTNRVLNKKREQYKVEGEKENNNNIPDTKFKPVLQRLLDLSDTCLSDKDIRDEMNNIIITGFETSSSIVCSTLLLLGTYPEIQEKCQQEIRQVFGDSDRDVTKDDLARLKYIEVVLKETLRICPVAPITGRVIAEDIQLRNTVLRKGHICVISLYGVLNSPKVWGPDVNEFIPERWLDPDRLPKNPNAFGAFGYGRRNCIGKVYAFMTMKVSLVHILRHYQIAGNYNNMKVKNTAVNKPAGGHEISLELRK